MLIPKNTRKEIYSAIFKVSPAPLAVLRLTHIAHVCSVQDSTFLWRRFSLVDLVNPAASNAIQAAKPVGVHAKRLLPLRACWCVATGGRHVVRTEERWPNSIHTAP